MAKLLGEIKTGASLRVVFDNAPVSIPVSAAKTYGDLARAVRGMSALRHSQVSAISVVFPDDRTAARAFCTRANELPDLALTSTESRVLQTNFDA